MGKVLRNETTNRIARGYICIHGEVGCRSYTIVYVRTKVPSLVLKARHLSGSAFCWGFDLPDGMVIISCRCNTKI